MDKKTARGFAHLVVIIVLVASGLGVLLLAKNSSRILAQITGQPQGKLVASVTTSSSSDPITFTTKNVAGVGGAQIDYIRYYLLNPNLAIGNTWGDPNWCGGIEPCEPTTASQFKTYDFGESSNPGNDYAIVWDSSTSSPDSAQTDRSLSAKNIPPGTYTVAVKIRDVDGHENGNASSLTITIESPSGIVNANPKTTSNKGSVTLTAKNVRGAGAAPIDFVGYYLLNPTLATGNTWGNPDWCASGSPCTQTTNTTFKTYDLGESSNPGNDYAIVWDANTKSPHSANTDRSLKPGNIPPGLYRVGLKIRDVNGSETGNASEVLINIIDPDTDGDGCTDVKEQGSNPALGGQRDPNNQWDFFDVPVPPLKAGVQGSKNKQVTSDDVNAILKFVGTRDNGPANSGGYDYDSDFNGNGVEDGREYDRTPSGISSQLWRSGPPNGAISIQDVAVAQSQQGHNCN